MCICVFWCLFLTYDVVRAFTYSACLLQVPAAEGFLKWTTYTTQPLVPTLVNHLFLWVIHPCPIRLDFRSTTFCFSTRSFTLTSVLNLITISSVLFVKTRRVMAVNRIRSACKSLTLPTRIHHYFSRLQKKKLCVLLATVQASCDCSGKTALIPKLWKNLPCNTNNDKMQYR